MPNLTLWPQCDSIAVYESARTGRQRQYPANSQSAPPRVIYSCGEPFHLVETFPVLAKVAASFARGVRELDEMQAKMARDHAAWRARTSGAA